MIGVEHPSHSTLHQKFHPSRRMTTGHLSNHGQALNLPSSRLPMPSSLRERLTGCLSSGLPRSFLMVILRQLSTIRTSTSKLTRSSSAALSGKTPVSSTRETSLKRLVPQNGKQRTTTSGIGTHMKWSRTFFLVQTSMVTSTTWHTKSSTTSNGNMAT